MDLVEKKKNLGRNITLFSALILIIGSVLPVAGFKNISVYGLEGDGRITVTLGLLIIASTFLKKIPKYTNTIFAALALALATFDYSKLHESTSAIKSTVSTNTYMIDVASTIEIGYGLQLVILGAIGAIAGSIIDLIQNKRA